MNLKEIISTIKILINHNFLGINIKIQIILGLEQRKFRIKMIKLKMNNYK